MNYKISKPFAMQSPSHPTLARLSALPVTALLALTVSACAAGPGETLQSATSVTHNCKPQETVGFSCELRDHRLLSLCASPGFEKFKGFPKDNPGYAYLVVGTQKGEVQYSYPPDPRDYKKHFFKGVPTNGIPYMFVTSDKGEFFFMAEQDDTDPLGAGQWTLENLPVGWSVGSKEEKRACARVLEFDNFYALGVTHDSVWRSKERERREAEKAKAKQP